MCWLRSRQVSLVVLVMVCSAMDKASFEQVQYVILVRLLCVVKLGVHLPCCALSLEPLDLDLEVSKKVR